MAARPRKKSLEKATGNKISTEELKATAKKAADVLVEETTAAVKTTEEKAEEVKEAVETVVKEQVVPEVKEAVSKVKKAATKREMKTSIVVEYQGRQVEEKEMVAAVKKAWTSAGHKIGDIKKMTLYVKPEENAVYYVINDKETGGVQF